MLTTHTITVPKGMDTLLLQLYPSPHYPHSTLPLQKSRCQAVLRVQGRERGRLQPMKAEAFVRIFCVVPPGATAKDFHTRKLEEVIALSVMAS